MIKRLHKFLIQLFIIATFFSGFVAFSQVSKKTSLDSLLVIVKEKIRVDEYSYAQNLIDSINSNFIIKTELDKIKINFFQSRVFYKTGKYEDALIILLDGFKKLKPYKDSEYYSETLGNIGVLFARTKNYNKAYYYYKKQLKNALYRNDSLQICVSYLNLGTNFHREEKMDSAKYFYDKVINNFPKSIVDKHKLSRTYSNLIGIYLDEEKYDIAIDYGKKALVINEEMKDTLGISATLMNLGSVSFATSDFVKAENHYTTAYEILKDRDDYKSKRNKRAAIRNISLIYQSRNEFDKAFKYLKEYADLLEAFHSANIKQKIAEIEAKYNLSEKGKQAEPEKNKRQNAEFWLSVFVGSTGVLLLFLWLVYRSQKFKAEKNALQFQKENLLQERKIEKVQIDTQIKILNATLDGKESERRQIAEILHNSVSALLSSAGLHLQAAKIELKENAPEEIEKSQSIISEAGEKIRDLSHKLISSVLLKFGLSYAMHDLCEKYSNSKLTFESDSKDIQRYIGEFEIKIHSIIEELINNIIKHSNANNANILLKQYDGRLQVRIYDDGDGFDVEKMRENISGGIGLTQIEARIKMMEGIFDIKSSKETGTRIFMDVPIPESN